MVILAHNLFVNIKTQTKMKKQAKVTSRRGATTENEIPKRFHSKAEWIRSLLKKYNHERMKVVNFIASKGIKIHYSEVQSAERSLA